MTTSNWKLSGRRLTRRNVSTLLAGVAMLGGSAKAQNFVSNTTIPGTEWRERFDISTPQASLPEVRQSPLLGTASVANVERAIQRYNDIVARGGWPTVPEGPALRVGVASQNVLALRRRLVASGDLEQTTGRQEIFDSFVEAAVKRFQYRHGIAPDGVVRAPTYHALNVPAERRLSQLSLNLGRLRTMAVPLGERYVAMNIPAAELEAVQGGAVIQRHSTVVGQIDRPSPILAVRIVEINFNPFWTVPASIVRRDLIPKMQKDPEYLAKNKIRIFDQTNNELSPQFINWNTEEAVNFRFRQDPGSINSLGNVRLGMPNTEAVYMHDTPQKSLFGGDARFHSSGCARVQNVRELVTWLLSDNPEWQRVRIDQAIRTDERIDAKLTRPVPVYWVYITAWANADGIIHFRDDVYKRDEQQLVGNLALPATPYDSVGPQAFVPGEKRAARVQ